jgi:predicted ATPase/DNA-binding SARP family transcriptional activator
MPAEFRLLGDVEVLIDGRVVEMGYARQRCVLVALLLDMNRLAPAEQLIDRVWAQQPPHRARNALSGYLSRLRQLLAPADNVRISRKPGGYVMSADPMSVDMHCFHKLVAAARGTEEDADAVALFDQALTLWRGEAFATLDTPWLNGVRALREAERFAAELDRNDAALRAGRHSELIGNLSASIRSHPLDERLTGQLMLALHSSGRQADALAIYQGLRKRLLEELGSDPCQQIQLTHQQILSSDPVCIPVASQSTSRPVADSPASGRRHNLPAHVSSFVGRGPELAEIGEVLSRTRALTLTGPGGVGKTRLAIELTRRRATSEDYPDGCWRVELVELRETDLVAGAVAAATGLRLSDEHPSVEAVVDALRSHRALLVLDDCERLVEPIAALATAMLAGCPGITVLATSREPLRVPGEVVWRLSPLQLPDGAPLTEPAQLGRLDAVQLFVQRARAAAPRFALDRVTAPSVALICRRLDGIPLAIELAAARMAHLSAAELAARLDDALGLLPRGATDRVGVDHRRTLAGTIRWSYNLLTETERVLFRRLSVLAGEFPLDAVEAVAAGAVTDPVGTLSRLIDKSLVVADTSGSAGLYHQLDVVRRYAAALLEPAERTECEHRCRVHYAGRTAHSDSVHPAA